MRSEFDTTTKLLLVLTGFMAIMVCLIAYIALFRTEDPLLAQAENPGKKKAADPELAEACDASTPEGAAQCPPGKYCLHDKCAPIDDLAVCGEGESCRDCDCDTGLVCHHFRCQDPSTLVRAPLECARNEALAKAVRNLQSKCASRDKSIGDMVSMRACSPADWEALAIDDPQFDLILAAFPGRFSVHYPTGLPKKSGQSWPTRQVREHYRGQLRRYKESLATAKQIFVIGRASPDGNRDDNYGLAVRRMDMVTQLIGEVVNEGLAETERKQVPVRAFAMRDAKPLNPERFKSSYLDTQGKTAGQSSPIVTWDETNQRRLTGLLDGGLDLKDQSSRDWNELFNAINRVVLVVPIPCDGTEYKPPKNVLDDEVEVEG